MHHLVQLAEAYVIRCRTHVMTLVAVRCPVNVLRTLTSISEVVGTLAGLVIGYVIGVCRDMEAELIDDI